MNHAVRPAANPLTMPPVDGWSAFRAAGVTRIEDPGVRAAWHRGRRWFSVWAIQVTCPLVAARVLKVQRALGARVRPLTPADLHVTLSIAGFATEHVLHDDDVLHETLAGQAEAVTAQVSRLALRVGGVDSFPGAAFLRVADPDGGLTPLRDLLDPPGRSLSIARYVPHVTIGTYVRQEATSSIANRLEPWREMPPLPITVNEVALLRFDAHVAGAPLIPQRIVQLRA